MVRRVLAKGWLLYGRALQGLARDVAAHEPWHGGQDPEVLAVLPRAACYFNLPLFRADPPGEVVAVAVDLRRVPVRQHRDADVVLSVPVVLTLAVPPEANWLIVAGVNLLRSRPILCRIVDELALRVFGA